MCRVCMCQVCMGRVCYVQSLYGPSLLCAELTRYPYLDLTVLKVLSRLVK